MNYIQFHLGDWVRSTQDLTPLERGVYFDLLQRYYQKERPLMQEECTRIARAYAPDAQEAMHYVLREFFTKEGDSYRHERCELEIAKYHETVEKRVNASKARWSKERAKKEERKLATDTEACSTKCTANGYAHALQMQSECTANGMLTNNQEPITNKEVVVGEIRPQPAQPVLRAAAAASPSAASPASLFPEEVSEPAPKSTSKYFPCPYEQIVRMYHEKLPMLPTIQTLTTQRKAAIKARWNQVIKEEKCKSPEEVLELFAFFFDRVAGNRFLTGGVDPSPGHSKTFRASLDWLMKESNFVKVAENYYAR